MPRPGFGILFPALRQCTDVNGEFTAPTKQPIILYFYMNVQGQIREYITSQPEPKRSDMQELHRIILEVMPACKLWF
jgi:hypothetical protein